MENILYILLSGFIISLASISGVALIKSHKKIAACVEKNLETMGALSGGIFLVTSISLGRETLHSLGTAQALVAFVIGIILYIMLQKITGSHRHMGDDHNHSHQHDKKSALKILVGDAIHNIADGLLLVTSFGTSLVTGFSTAFSILLHETPQEISEFLVLRKSGYTNKEALYKNIATAMSIFIGIGLGFILINTQTLQGYLLGISAAFFIGIIFNDLFPVWNLTKSAKSKKTIIAFALGFVAMFSIISGLREKRFDYAFNIQRFTNSAIFTL
ncbi:MAG: ZIP family metal transporter, partial [Minisyncoccia bacterium]